MSIYKSITLISCATVVLSSCDKLEFLDNINGSGRQAPAEISWDEAQGQTGITIHFENRTIDLNSEWVSQIEWSNSDEQAWFLSEFTPLNPGESRISRSFMSDLPDNQTKQGHYEAFGMFFRRVTETATVDTVSGRYHLDNVFEDRFIEEGPLAFDNGVFTFWQTYVWGERLEGESTMEIESVQPIIGRTGVVFVTGRFHGNYHHSEYAEGPIVSGDFKLIIQN